MSRKHFIAIAAAIKALRQGADPEHLYPIDRVAEALADTFENFNPVFDRERFLTACGVGDEQTTRLIAGVCGRPEHTESQIG